MQPNPNVRQIQQSPLYQGIGESIAWPVDVSAWVSGPTSPVVKIYRASDNEDLTSTLLPGAATVSGDVITCPLLSGLTLGVKYRLEVKFTVGSNIFVAWAWVWGQ